jgi:hypothetical protein
MPDPHGLTSDYAVPDQASNRPPGASGVIAEAHTRWEVRIPFPRQHRRRPTTHTTPLVGSSASVEPSDEQRVLSGGRSPRRGWAPTTACQRCFMLITLK